MAVFSKTGKIILGSAITVAGAAVATLIGIVGKEIADDKLRYDQYGYDEQGFDRRGFDRQGYDRQGYNAAGVNREGFNRRGYDAEGYDHQGFAEDGYNREGYDRRGIDHEGYDRQGYGEDHYDRSGLDRVSHSRQYYSEQLDLLSSRLAEAEKQLQQGAGRYAVFDANIVMEEALDMIVRHVYGAEIDSDGPTKDALTICEDSCLLGDDFEITEKLREVRRICYANGRQLGDDVRAEKVNFVLAQIKELLAEAQNILVNC